MGGEKVQKRKEESGVSTVVQLPDPFKKSSIPRTDSCLVLVREALVDVLVHERRLADTARWMTMDAGREDTGEERGKVSRKRPGRGKAAKAGGRKQRVGVQSTMAEERRIRGEGHTLCQ